MALSGSKIRNKAPQQLYNAYNRAQRQLDCSLSSVQLLHVERNVAIVENVLQSSLNTNERPRIKSIVRILTPPTL